MRDESFLEPAERELFAQSGRYFERTIEEQELLAEKQLVPRLLTRHMCELVGTGASRASFKLICITVGDRDGMSWSAEAVRRALSDQVEHHRRSSMGERYDRWSVCSRLRPAGLPLIATFIGSTKLLKIAVRSKVTEAFFTLRSSATLLVLVAAAGVGLISGLQREAGTHLVDKLLNPWAILPFACFAAMAFLLKPVLTTYLKRSESDALKQFSTDLDSARGSQRYETFVDAIVDRLIHGPFPRLLIVDNYTALDTVTKDALRNYLRRRAKRVIDGSWTSGTETWVVFEPIHGSELVMHVAAEAAIANALNLSWYQQQYLVPPERQHLARANGRPAEAAEFRSVARICRDDSVGQQRIEVLLRDWRSKHVYDKELYGPLDFLYLLALTATPGELHLNQGLLETTLSKKRSTSSEVLKKVLRGSRLTKDEIASRLKELRAQFSPLLETPKPCDVRVSPDAAHVLENHWRELQLVDPALGHLFWSLVWLPVMQSDARGYRKLAHHLRLCDHGTLAETESRALSEHLHDSYLNVVQGCLQTCLFEHVRDLLARASRVYDDHDKPAFQQRRFVTVCWEAYNVTGDDSILVLLLEQLTKHPRFGQSGTETSNELDALFFETLPLTTDRAALTTFLTRSTAAGAVDMTSGLAELGGLRAAWLVLLLSNGNVRLRALKLPTLLSAAWSRSSTTVRTMLDELQQAPIETWSPTRLLALSTGLWSMAMACSTRVFGSAGTFGLPGQPHALLEQFEQFAQAAEDAVLIADDLRQKHEATLDPRSKNDLLFKGLVQELCIVALAGLVLADRMMQGLVRGRLQERFEDLAKIANHSFSLGIPTRDVGGSPVVTRLTDLMAFCTLLWRRFDLKTAADTMNLRRVFFRFTCAQADATRHDLLLRQVEALGVSVKDESFTGLIANLTLACSYRGHWELSAHYLQAAASLAHKSHFGSALRSDLNIMVLYSIGPSHAHTAALFDELTSLKDGSACALLEYLRRTPDDELADVSARLLAVLNEASDDRFEMLVAIIRSACDGRAQATVSELQDLLELTLLKRRAQRGAPIGPGSFSYWDNRKNSWTYALVLELLLKGERADEYWDEALTLVDRTPTSDVWNSYFHLALRLGQKLLFSHQPQGRSVVLRYLKTAGPYFGQRERAETNVRLYNILHELDPDNAEEYASERERYQAIVVERDHLARLPALVQEGKFFLVFYEYYMTWRFWGLSADTSAAQVQQMLTSTEQQSFAAVHEWHDAGGLVPEPLIHDEQGWHVNSRFMSLGHYLFTPPCDQEAQYALHRKRFDAHAKTAFPRLVDVVVHLPMLPVPLATLIRRHADRFSGALRAVDSILPSREITLEAAELQPA